MIKPKTDKLLKGFVGTSLALATLSGCGVTRHELISTPEYEEDNYQSEQAQLLPPPNEADCDTWRWDEEGEAFQCVQEGSTRHGHYYYGGSWFPTFAAFMLGRASAGHRSANPGISDNRNRTNTQVAPPRTNTNPNNGAVSGPRSGMGSGGSTGG